MGIGGAFELPVDRLLVRKPSAAAAGMKAFLTIALATWASPWAIFLIWLTTARSISAICFQPPSAHCRRRHDDGAYACCCCWGVRKNVPQFPLHVWLPDAMEGPTPRQRVDPRRDDGYGGRLFARPLHAVVCRVARGRNMPWRRSGALPPCLAAIIAITQNDLKRILAYSTISQLGYMFVALGLARLARRDGRHVSSCDPCVFQGPAVPRGRERDARDGRRRSIFDGSAGCGGECPSPT